MKIESKAFLTLFAIAALAGCVEQRHHAEETREALHSAAANENVPTPYREPEPTLSRDFPDKLVEEGIELSDVGRHAEAIARFELATSIADDTTEALIGKAFAQSRLHRYQDAIATLESPLLSGNAEARQRLEQLRAPRTPIGRIIPLRLPDVRPHDLEWMLVVEASGETFNFQYEGKRFLKVGTPRALHRQERDLLDSASDSLGFVYTRSSVSPIEQATLLPPERLGGWGLTVSRSTAALLLHVGDRFHAAYTVVMEDLETNRFRWMRVSDGTERQFGANDVVPRGFAPITSLGLAEVPGMDGVDAVPQLNSRGIEQLRHLSRARVRLWGVPLRNRWKQAVILAEDVQIPTTVQARQYVVFHGDGHWRWVDGVGHDPNAIEVTVLGHADMGPVFIDPFDAPIWTFRRERLHDHSIF